MSNIPNENINQILLDFQTTFSSSDDKKRKEAEKNLKKSSQNPYLFIQKIINSITMDSNIINDQLKKSITIYIKNLIINNGENLSKEDQINLIQLFSLIQLNNNLNSSICNHLNSAIIKLFSCKTIIDDYQLIINFASNYYSFQLNQKEKNIIQSYNNLMLFKNIFNTKSLQKNNVDKIFEEIIKLFDNLFDKYKNDLGDLNIDSLDLFSEIYDFMYFIIIKIKQIDENNFEKKIELLFSKYGNYVYEIISTNKNNDSHNSIIYLNLNNNISEKMNILKTKNFQFLSAVIQYLGEIIKENNLINMTSSIIKLVINSLENLIEEYNLLLNEIKSDNDHLNNIIYNMIIFLTRSLIREPIKSNFEPLVFKFLLNIIFPFLISIKKDEEELINNPEEYNVYLNDLIFNHKIKNYKVSISFLILKILDNFIENKIKCISFTLQLLDYTLKIENNENIDIQKFPILLNLNHSEFSLLNKQKISNEKLIDLLLLIIIILKNNLIQNKSNIIYLKKIVVQYFQNLNLINSLIIKNKLCYFYSTYFSYLYNEFDINNEDIITNIFLFLFNQVTNSKEKFLAYQSSSAIILMLNNTEGDNYKILNSLINKNLMKLIPIINNNDNYQFFELLEEIVEKNYLEEELKFQLLREISKKVEKDVKEMPNTSSNTDLILQLCFNIIINIIKKNSLDENKINDFENIIQPIFIFIKEPEKINFEEEIITIIKEEIVNVKKITFLSLSILQYLIPINKKNEEIVDSIYYFLFNFFKIDFENNSNYIFKEQDLLFQILNNSLDIDIDSSFSDFFEFNLIRIFVILNSKLNSIQIKQIFDKVYSKALEEEIEEEEDFEGEIEKINFEVISTISCCMYNYPSLISKFIEENSINAFLKLVENALDIKKYKIYLGKTIILGFLNIIMTEQFKDIDIIVSILVLIFKYLLRQKNEENSYMKNLMKKDLNCNFIKDTSDIEEDNNNDIEEDEKTNLNEILNYQNINYSLNWIPNNNIDEFETFVKCILNINDEIKNKFRDNLSEYEKLMFNDLIHTRRISIEYKKIKMTVPRRIVHIKKKGE